MSQPRCLLFSLAKAEYLLNHTTKHGEDGDRRKFWRGVVGFESAQVVREALLAEVSVDLRSKGQNVYGDR